MPTTVDSARRTAPRPAQPAERDPRAVPAQPRVAGPDDPNARTTITRAAATATLRDLPVVTAKDMPAAVWDAPVDGPTRQAPRGLLPALLDEPGREGAEVQKPKVWVATHKPPEEADRRLILVNEPDSTRAACFRVLRHRLQERSDPRLIAVSSAEPGAGKTTCAANLALALSECNRARVLLIEANRRAPQLAALFGFLPPECFAAQLERHREKPLDPWSVVEVFSPSLHVLAVKPGPENENKPLRDGVAFGIAMEMLRRSGYDYIVVDTPPVLGSADVNIVEDYCDGILLCARSRETSGRALRHAIDQLSPAKILGITLLDA